MAATQQPDADDIIRKSRELTLISALSSDITLTITEKNGSVRKRTISMTSKSFPDGTEKRLIRFIEPADVKGTSLLIVDNQDIADEMWIYLPALKRTRRLVSSEKGKSFMSSEFSNSDMSSPPLSDFRNMYLDQPEISVLWVIESIPVDEDIADEYGYSKKVSFIDKETLLVKKIEFYNFDNQLFKIMEIDGAVPVSNGKFVIKEMTAKNLSNGRSSEIVMNNITQDTSVDDDFFSLRNLQN